MGAGQGGVTAEIDLHLWREPAQLVKAVSGYHESGLGQVVLRGDRLEDIVVGPLLEETDAAGFPAKALPVKASMW